MEFLPSYCLHPEALCGYCTQTSHPGARQDRETVSIQKANPKWGVEYSTVEWRLLRQWYYEINSHAVDYEYLWSSDYMWLPNSTFKSLWPFNPSSQGIYPHRAFPPSSQHQATVISSQASMKVARFVWRNWNLPNSCCVPCSRIPFTTPHHLSLWSNRPLG